MTYNMDFLFVAMILLVLVLWHYYSQRRPDNLNNRAFLIFVVLGSLDVLAEILSTYYIISTKGSFGIGAVLTTTVFYVFQALLPYVFICYICTLRENHTVSWKCLALCGVPTLILLGIILTNPFTGLLFSFDAYRGYVKGSWYMLMYASALFHILAAFMMVLAWKKKLDRQKIRTLREIVVLTAGGVLIQSRCQWLLMTGFGLSLAILTLFFTINNPYTNSDSMTGLYDKPCLIRKMDEMIRSGRQFHLIMVDVYQLSHINKVAGIRGGDRLLQELAERMQLLAGARAFRTAGKHFVLLAISLEEYERFLKTLKGLFEKDMILGDAEQWIKCPAILSGIVNAEKLEDGNMVLSYAEYLESLSLKMGSTEVVQNDAHTKKSFLYNKQVENFLYTAIEEDLFQVYYQPVYSTRNKQFVTLEALSRLKHPEFGWIAPDIFIRIAEDNCLIDRISDLQFYRICRFLKEHSDLMKQIRNVKINLSPLDLMRKDCSGHFIRIMDEFGLPHEWVQFEITETVATEYNTGLCRVVDDFVKDGIGLCLDDFGSGYANLNTVMQLPFSVIKLDRSLLFHICTDERAASFYQSVVSTFQHMGYRIISEGVETESEMELLSSWGVDMIQGYYFSRPLPPEELLKLLG